MTKLRIAIILASVRPNRFGAHPAAWLMDIAAKRADMMVTLLDLQDHTFPNFANPVSPAHVEGPSYGDAATDAWAAKIAAADAFIVVTPEYNNGYPGSLKNAIDRLYKEWNRKPIAFVGYGMTGGARVVSQLRSVATELQMAPIRNSVHIMFPWNLVEADGSLKPGALDVHVKGAERMLDQLAWWANALKIARESV